MQHRFSHYFIHDRLFRFLVFGSTILFVFMIVMMIWNPADRRFDRRKQNMKRCVELGVASPTKEDYEVRFEDAYFCPKQSYTVLEAIQRAESVLNIQGKPLNIAFSTTPDGVIITSMFGVENSQNGRWLPAVGGSEITDEPLDRIILQGPTKINFYYR